jgi:DNA-binding MurR/RpiR family transcriptional regulator
VAAIAAAMANPPAGQERWTARSLAKHVGVSHSTVLRVWRDQQTQGLKA